MRVFISYHTPDGAKAHAVEAGLARTRPGTECYLAPRSNVAGAYWLPRLAEEIAAADAVLFLAGTRIGPWQELEYYEALRVSRSGAGRPRLVPVVMTSPAPGLPFFAQLHQIFAAEPAIPEALAAIIRALDESLPADEHRWQHFQPYKGLPALQEADAAFFFGRESETATILDLFVRRPDRIVALLGQSGVGKSSLARAGIISRLKSQAWPLAQGAWPASLADSRAFLPLVVRPGDQPLKELALAFAQLYETSPAEINREADSWAQQLAGGTRLRDVLHAARDRLAQALGAEPPRRFVLYIDQGEELYAEGNAASAGRFSRLLAEAAEHEAFSVLMSLRSDYYTPYQNDRDLFDASERVDILPLADAALTEIIHKPAETLGARFESIDMVRRIVDATQRESGALPLLSDLMHDVWLGMLERGDGVLRWSDSPDIVDVAAPLRKRADAFLAEHEEDTAALRRLFTLHLAQVPKIGEPVRRRARRSECDPGEWRLAETLASERWRLLSVAGAADAEPIVEVAHEQLLRRWPRLSEWLTEEREFLVWRSQIEEDATEPGADLLTGRRLSVARLWFERRADDLAPELRDYIAASIEADDHRVAAEHQQQRRKLQASAVALVVALVLVGLTGWQWNVANREKHEAEAQRARAENGLAVANDLILSLAQQFRKVGLPVQMVADSLHGAVKLLEQLAAGGETSPDLRRSQAAALIETANTLLTIGDSTGALTGARQAHDIVQELLSAAPDNKDYQSMLSSSDNKIGDALLAQGNLTGARIIYSDSQVIIEKALGPYHPDVAATLEKLARLEIAQGRFAEAEPLLKRSLAIWERALGSDHPRAATGLNNLGELYLLEGRYAEAEPLLKNSLAILERALGPEDPNVATGLNILAVLYWREGRYTDTEALFKRSLAIRKALAAKDPSNAQWQRDLADSDESIGALLQAQGDLDGALAAYRDGLAIRKVLAAKDPSNAQWQRDLAKIDESIGDVLRVQGDFVGALASYRDGLGIREVQAQKVPRDVEWQDDLADGDAKIGDVLQAQGDLDGALAAYRDGLAIRKALAAKDPSNTRWQRNLANSDESVGDVLRVQGDFVGTLTAYRDGLAIRKALAAKDPNNAQWQRDLAGALGNLAWTLVLDNEPQDALDAVNEALKHDPSLLFLQGNKAAALLLLGRFEEAKAIYFANRDKPLDGKTFADMVRKDFATMRKFGIDTPDMKRIEALLQN